MVKVCLVLLFFQLLLITDAFGAEPAIRVSTETDTVYLGDSIAIDVESVGLLEPLDVSHWRNNDQFLRETTGTRIAVIGGKVVEIKIRRMEFIANSVGVQTFGPLQGVTASDNTSSNSIAVKVLPTPEHQWKVSPEDYSITLSVNQLAPYVGQQLVLNIILQHKYPISGEVVELPKLDSMETLALYEARRTLTNDGIQRTAWRYLIHPTRSGNINTGPLRWSGTFNKSRTQRGEFAVEKSGVLLNVKPSQLQSNNWWLPAKSVSLTDSWSQEVTQLSAGEQVLRTITLEAIGVLSSQLPVITPLASRAISSTLISTEREQQVEGSHTRARAKFTYRMTAQSPIPVFLDTVRLEWWDVTKNEVRESIIPSRRINVGLPEKAELLADLALNESSWRRWQLHLISIKNIQNIGLSLAIAALGLLCLSQLKHVWRSVSFQLRKRLILNKIKQQAKLSEWQALYHLLQSLVPKQGHENKANLHAPILANNKAKNDLIDNLSQQLFSKHASGVNKKHLKNQIEALEFETLYMKSRDNKNRSKALLAL